MITVGQLNIQTKNNEKNVRELVVVLDVRRNCLIKLYFDCLFFGLDM